MTDTVQYRDFIFPNNPQSITVTRGTETARHFCPGRGDVVQQLGGRGRLVQCSGSFFAGTYAGALAHLERFCRTAARPGESGTLFLPGMEPFLAYLTELRYEAAGDGRIIPYTMTFQEAGELA